MTYGKVRFLLLVAARCTFYNHSSCIFQNSTTFWKILAGEMLLAWTKFHFTKFHPLNTYFQQEKKTCWHLKWFLWHPFLWSKHLWSQVKLFQPDRSSAPLSFSELPGWMGNAAASPRIHSPTRTNQTQAKTAAGWCYLEGPMLWGDFWENKHGGNFGEVNHAWEGDAFLTKHCELCIREFYMLVLMEESCQTKIA